MRLIFLGLPHLRVYQSGTVPAWTAGEVREVDGDLAAYLLSTFPEAFAVSGALETAPAPGAATSSPGMAAPTPPPVSSPARSRKRGR